MFYLYFVYIVSNSAVLTFSTEDKGFVVIIILFLFFTNFNNPVLLEFILYDIFI
uniref:Uncharacterized protein n=1 Tax=Anguilla anguilla TaxID=7936 RepID=A0A0E9WIA2_ANGAN